MADIGTFDLRETTITLGGVSIDGFAKGDVITIEQEGDTFGSEAGADGHVDRVKNNTATLKITLQLRQTSPTNDALSAVHIADKLTNKGIVPFAFLDKNGTTIVTAASAWIPKPATIVNGEEAKQREWVIMTGTVFAHFVGGNE